MGRPPLNIEVSQKDQKQLAKILRGGIQQVRVVLRALALLQLAMGIAAPRIAGVIPLTAQAIRNVGRRYQQGGLDRALYEKQRPGAAEVLDDSQKQRLIAMVCSSPPEGRARWTVRLVAQEAVKRKLVPRVGRETIRILLLSHDLKPWREKNVGGGRSRWRLHRQHVLEVYERPYDPQQPVICLDEKPVSLHADVRPASPAAPGREARRDNEYERCGTANVFYAVEPKAGRHFTFATPDRSGFEFAQVAVNLAMAYPEAKTIHLVMNNLNIHRRKALADVFGLEMADEVWNRFTVHYTPTHGSWLNQAEIEIGIFSRQCLSSRRIPSLKALRQEAKAWKIGSEIWERFTVHFTPTHGSWLNQAEIEIGLFSRQCVRTRRIPDFKTLRRESRAWNRRMNRDRIKINWKFDRRAARRKFGYKRKSFTRSEPRCSPQAALGHFWEAPAGQFSRAPKPDGHQRRKQRMHYPFRIVFGE